MARNPQPVAAQAPELSADDVYDFIAQMLPEPTATPMISLLQSLLESTSISTDFGGDGLDDGLGADDGLGGGDLDAGLDDGLGDDGLGADDGLGGGDLGGDLDDGLDAGGDLDGGDLGADLGGEGDLGDLEPVAAAPAARGGRGMPAKPAAAAPAPADEPEFQVGDPVMAQWDDGQMYPATITQVNTTTRKARVDWEDGSPSKVVLFDQMEYDGDDAADAPAAPVAPAPAPAPRAGRTAAVAPAAPAAPAATANTFTFDIALGANNATVERRYQEYYAEYKTAKSLKEYAATEFGVQLKGSDKAALADIVAQLDLTTKKLQKLDVARLTKIAAKYGVVANLARSRSDTTKVNTLARALATAALENYGS